MIIINKKIILLFVLLLIIGAFIWLLFFNIQFNPAREENKQPDIANKPEKNQDVSCEQLTNRAKDLCQKQKALLLNNSSECRIINDEDVKIDCLSKVDVKIAIENKDLIACQKISETMLVKTCLEKIIKEDFAKIDCESLDQGENVIFCLSEKNGRLARKSQDVKFCQKIPEGIKKANCLSELLKIDLHSDTDNDGLDFLQEIINGADPDNPDTDGDGQPDGVEIKNNYNPDGLGRLNQPALANIFKCYNIEDSILKFSCFAEFSDAQFDIVKCDLIKNQELKNYCIEKFKEFISK